MDMIGVLDIVEPDFYSLWRAAHKEIPIAWDNAPEDIEPGEPWIRFTVIPTRVTNGTMEGDKQVSGFITIQVFTPLDTGVKEAYSLADEISQMLENRAISSVLTYGADVVRVGEGKRRIKDVEYGLFQVNVKVPFDAQ